MRILHADSVLTHRMSALGHIAVPGRGKTEWQRSKVRTSFQAWQLACGGAVWKKDEEKQARFMEEKQADKETAEIGTRPRYNLIFIFIHRKVERKYTHNLTKQS